jgi:hypothetical protein
MSIYSMHADGLTMKMRVAREKTQDHKTTHRIRTQIGDIHLESYSIGADVPLDNEITRTQTQARVDPHHICSRLSPSHSQC